MNRPQPATDDSTIIDAVLAGQTERFSELVHQYQDRLFNGVARMVGAGGDAEDIVQDAFIQAFSKLDSFKANSSFYTWIYRIAINTAINFCRRRRRIGLTTIDSDNGAQMLAAADESPSYRMELGEQAKEVHDGLNRLSDEHRHILVLREMDELSYEEIAEILDLPVGTVRSRLHRARLQLRDLLIAAEQTKSTN